MQLKTYITSIGLSDFLKKFMNGYKIKGKEISYEEFGKKFITDLERDNLAFEFVKPIPGINFSESEERSNTKFIDCGDYCFYFLPSGPSGRGYIGFVRQVETPLQKNNSAKQTLFD